MLEGQRDTLNELVGRLPLARLPEAAAPHYISLLLRPLACD